MSDVDPPSFPRVPLGVFDDPQFLKKFELERELGVGGAGVVVCARHRELDERVAIKFLLSGSESPEAVARFRREARAAHRVKSEHVVGIVDVSSTVTGVPYVVMEYLEGTDLERLLLESPEAQLPVRDAIDFVLQACEALAECHAIGIVHRDLKPSNLFCTDGPDGFPVIKVLDFGISKLSSTNIDDAMTGRHAIIGSPRYMSPEQFATPADVDHRTDIWALGVILYELVGGAAPFVGNTLISIWERVKTVTPAPVSELRRDAPRALDSIVAHCLEKDRDQRYLSVADLAKALLPLASERMRATVARIVRILEAPGVTTESLSLPPSLRPSTHGATSVSVASSSPELRSQKAFIVAGFVAAGVAGALLFLRGLPKQEAELPAPLHGLASARDAASPVPSTTPIVAPSAALLQPLPNTPAVAEPPAPSTGKTTASPPISPTGHAAPAATTEARRPTVATLLVPSVAPPASPSAVPSAAPPAPASAASSTAAPPVVAGTAPKPSPWVVDIVEQRERKSGAAP